MKEILEFFETNVGYILVTMIFVPVMQIIFSSSYNEVDALLMDKTHVWKKNISDFVFDRLLPTIVVMAGITLILTPIPLEVKILVGVFVVTTLTSTRNSINIFLAAKKALKNVAGIEDKLKNILRFSKKRLGFWFIIWLFNIVKTLFFIAIDIAFISLIFTLTEVWYGNTFLNSF